MASQLGLSNRVKDKACEGNIWVEILGLVSKHGALNMALGFPDFRPPENVLEALSNAAIGNNHMNNHYTRAYGHPRLIDALAKLYSITMGREINAMTNINITVGAFEALYCTFMGLINPGDEVILIEPFYEPYKEMLRLAGAVPVYIPLRMKNTSKSLTSSEDWTFDPSKMREAFNSKTKAIVVNNPSNPLGKAPTLPGMWDRTVTIGSAGKTFSVTGWKVGWAVAPSNLIQGIKTIHDAVLRTNPTPTQEAIAVSLETELSRLGSSECYFNSLPREMEMKRDLLCKYLSQAGITVVVPEGGYFIVADISKLDTNGCVTRDEDGQAYDYKFVKWAIHEKKFCAMPVSICYSQEHKYLGEKYVRICFVKTDETLNKAKEILLNWNITRQDDNEQKKYKEHETLKLPNGTI
ncbi:CCBL [Mytilus coruscus]|uniref:kynurenine--oxoglutarate transaminase n=1 Tax=Mytilus coruscus TaxID=42192 RepID=A0A6J8C6F8_MYTCO|nr:CCBL [Mytilus coruscus]